MFSFKNKSILVVDDQKAFHVMLRTMLTDQGAKKITLLDSVDSAVRMSRRRKFDIYLIDYNLGIGRNGAQLIAYLRSKKLVPRNAICFIITGDNTKARVLTAIETDPDDYLMKPFSQSQLIKRLTVATEKKELFSDIFFAIENKDYPKAIALCKNQINSPLKYKGTCTNILSEVLIKTQEYQAVEELLAPLLDERILIRAGINLSKSYFYQEKYSLATELLEKIIKQSPLQMEAHQWLARTHQKQGNSKQALRIMRHAADTTHHSIELHQEVAQLANELDEHRAMLESFAAILQLSRTSFYPDPCHLANYIHSLFKAAKNEPDMQARVNILQQVSAALFKGRTEEGQSQQFDFELFEKICEAQIMLYSDKGLQAKRRILKALNNIDAEIKDLDDIVLTQSTLSLLNLGEFEDAAPYLEELKKRDVTDTSMKSTIEQETGDQLEGRMGLFRIQNNIGIKAFTHKEYDKALKFFNSALNLEPLNSGALLNKVQVYIKLLKIGNRSSKEECLINCIDTIRLLRNTQLSAEHQSRYNKLKNQLQKIAPKSSF